MWHSRSPCGLSMLPASTTWPSSLARASAWSGSAPYRRIRMPAPRISTPAMTPPSHRRDRDGRHAASGSSRAVQSPQILVRMDCPGRENGAKESLGRCDIGHQQIDANAARQRAAKILRSHPRFPGPLHRHGPIPNPICRYFRRFGRKGNRIRIARAIERDGHQPMLIQRRIGKAGRQPAGSTERW
jgi:hypothetical protein